jgi:FixJ family two-component response regulator
VSKPQILLVDDDQALLQALPHMVALRMHGLTVDTTDSAYKALEQLQDQEYDVVVSDIKMPGMDGLELLGKIHELRPEVPVILITGHADQELTTQALRGGAYDFVQKPIDRVYFVAALHRAMQTRQLRRQVQEQHAALEEYTRSLEQIVERRTRELLAGNEAMEVLVRDLFDTSLIETNKLVLHRTRCNLVELCQQVLKAYTTAAGLALDFGTTEEVIEIDVDEERISQVLIHLLFEARNYSSRGAPIVITVRHTDDKANITIREDDKGTGEGVPSGFEHFYRILQDDEQMAARSNEGLRLYLAQQIVERHGGYIEIESSATARGRAFAVILPLPERPQDEKQRELVQVTRAPAPFEPPKWLVS